MKKALADVNEKLKASASHESVKIAVVCFFFPSNVDLNLKFLLDAR